MFPTDTHPPVGRHDTPRRDAAGATRLCVVHAAPPSVVVSTTAVPARTPSTWVAEVPTAVQSAEGTGVTGVVLAGVVLAGVAVAPGEEVGATVEELGVEVVAGVVPDPLAHEMPFKEPTPDGTGTAAQTAPRPR